MARNEYLAGLADAEDLVEIYSAIQRMQESGVRSKPGQSVEDAVSSVLAIAFLCASVGSDIRVKLRSALTAAVHLRAFATVDPRLTAFARWEVRARGSKVARDSLVALGGLDSAW